MTVSPRTTHARLQPAVSCRKVASTMKLAFWRSFLCGALVLVAGGLLPAGTSRLQAQEEQTPAVRAPLGATPQQIGELYGKVLRHNARVRRHQILEGGTVIDGDLYSRNGLVIRVVFHAGVAVLLEYTRVEGPLTAQDASLLLAANADASTWESGKDSTETSRFYRRADGKALAHYATEYDGSLMIASDNFSNDFYGGRLIEGH